MDYRPFPKITKDFVEQQIHVGWEDLAWAASNHWLDINLLAELADRLSVMDEDLRTMLATAAMDRDEAALKALIDRQAEKHSVPDELTRKRWMRLAVAWLYQHRDTFDDPWAVIEEIWEAFGHPSELSGLVKWMPVPPGDEVGEEAMLKRWRALATPLH